MPKSDSAVPSNRRSQNVNDPGRDARLAHPAVWLVTVRQGLAHFHYFKIGTTVGFEVKLVRPENVHSGRPIFEIRRNDLHGIPRLGIAVLGEVFRRERGPLVEINLRRGNDVHDDTVGFEQGAQVAKQTYLIVHAGNVVESEC